MCLQAQLPKMAFMLLTVPEILSIERPGIYAVACEVPGFSFRVSRGDGRSWVLRAMMHGKRREMGLGSCKSVSLMQAKGKAAGVRSLLDRDLDPFAVFASARDAADDFNMDRSAGPPSHVAAVTAFAVFGYATLDDDVWSALRDTVLARLGDFPLSLIRREDLEASIEPLRGTPMEKRLREVIGDVFRWAGQQPADGFAPSKAA